MGDENKQLLLACSFDARCQFYRKVREKSADKLPKPSLSRAVQTRIFYFGTQYTGSEKKNVQ